LTWPGIASCQNYQNHENQIRKIIDFESGRRALPTLDFHDEQNRVRLTQPGGVHCGLRLDWLEFLQTAAFFVLLSNERNSRRDSTTLRRTRSQSAKQNQRLGDTAAIAQISGINRR
jgi:hypothetical protein